MNVDMDQFGDSQALLYALGIVGANDGLNDDWFRNPQIYLKRVLSNANQRENLLALARQLAGDGAQNIEQPNWILLFEHQVDIGLTIKFFIVLDDEPKDVSGITLSPSQVHISLGVEFSTKAPFLESNSHLCLPLFRSSKDNNTVPSPELFGQPGGIVEIGTRMTLRSTPLLPNEAGLEGISFKILVPTAPGQLPSVSFELNNLQLPGQAAPQDFVLSDQTDLDELSQDAMGLVMGLLQAQLNDSAASQISALATLFGLDQTSAIPSIPMDAILANGPDDLRGWLLSIFQDPTHVTAWYSALATLFGDKASSLPEGIRLEFGTLNVDIEFGLEFDGQSIPVLAPRISAGLQDNSPKFALSITPMILDFASGSVTAVPDLRLQLIQSLSAINPPEFEADRIHVGFALNTQREVILVLEILDARIRNNNYERIDLTNPDAMVEIAGSQAFDLVQSALVQAFGSAGNDLSIVLGISAPAGVAPGFPVLSFSALLLNPIEAIRDYWIDVSNNFLADVPKILLSLRKLVTGNGVLNDIAGEGTIAAPWRIPLVAGLAILVHRDDDLLVVGVAYHLSTHDLADQCTVLETTIALHVAEFDLAIGQALFCGAIRWDILARARGGRDLKMRAGPLKLDSEAIWSQLHWKADSGLGFAFDILDPEISLDNIQLNQSIPNITLGLDGMVEEDWDNLERIIGIVGSRFDWPWLSEFVIALGWGSVGDQRFIVDPLRLRLFDLVDDATHALRLWLMRQIQSGADEFQLRLRPIFNLLSGLDGGMVSIEGDGSLHFPYLVSLQGSSQLPKLAVWFEPDGVTQNFEGLASDALRSWHPGDEGLDTGGLTTAILNEASLNPSHFFGEISGARLSAGLQSLEKRFEFCEGLVSIATALPNDARLRVIENASMDSAMHADNFATEVIGQTPDKTVFISVVVDGQTPPDFGVAPDHIADLRDTARDDASFAPLDDIDGRYHILLPARATLASTPSANDGFTRQAARIVQALSAWTDPANTAVIAGFGSGHAAWSALDALPQGPEHLVAVGLPLAASQIGTLADDVTYEAARRLEELLPSFDALIPDDPDLDLARALLTSQLPQNAVRSLDAAIPQGWTPTKTRSFQSYHVYTSNPVSSVARAFTAAAAAGLSLQSKAAVLRSELAHLESIATGLVLPIETQSNLGELTLKGQVKGDILAAELDFSGADPDIQLRDERKISAHFDLTRNGGWVLGGNQIIPLDLELRGLQIDIQTTYTGSRNFSLEIALIGARLYGRSYPRAKIVIDSSARVEGVEGLFSATSPEISQVLSIILDELRQATEPMLNELYAWFKLFGIINDSDGFDSISLTNWLDDGAIVFEEILDDAVKFDELLNRVEALLGTTIGINLDKSAKRCAVSLAGSTRFDPMPSWQISALIGAEGLVDGSLSLGDDGGMRLESTFDPFTISWQIGPLQNDLSTLTPNVVPIWPVANFGPVLANLPESILSFGLSKGLEALRQSDPSLRTALDPLMQAIGALGSTTAGAITISPLLFSNPLEYLQKSTVLGAVDGSLSPGKAVAIFEAIKPFLGLSGGGNQWRLTNGLAIECRSNAGIELRFLIDPDALLGATPIELALSAGLNISPNWQIAPSLQASATPSSAIGINHVLLLNVSGGSVSFQIENGAQVIELYPGPPDFSAIVGAGVEAALPIALNAISDQQDAFAHFIDLLGNALDWRTAGEFDGAKITPWCQDPVTRLRNDWAGIVNSVLGEIGPLLPAPRLVLQRQSNVVTLTAFEHVDVVFDARGAGFEVQLILRDAPVPILQTLNATIAFNSQGLARFELEPVTAAIPISAGLTFNPSLQFEVGSAVASPFVAIGLLTHADQDRLLDLSFDIASSTFELSYQDAQDPVAIANGFVDLILNMLGGFILEIDAVEQFLDTSIGNVQIRDILNGVLLSDNGSAIDPELFRFFAPIDTDLIQPKLSRLSNFLENLAAENLFITIGDEVDIGIQKDNATNNIGLNLSVKNRFALVDSDLSLWIENDERWILDDVAPGVSLGLVSISGANFEFEPSVTIGGVGLRIGRNHAPLLANPIGIGSVAVHTYADVSAAGVTGGGRVEVAEFSLAPPAATGGSNAIADGLLADASAGDEPLAAVFSPALSIQNHDNALVFDFRAGEGDGPWWLPVGRQFGPLNIQQIGLGRQMQNQSLSSVSILFDGGVSIAGLSAQVDELELKLTIEPDGPIDSQSWSADLAGIAVNADISGVTLMGGLRKSSPPDELEYIGMLSARFGTYGLSIYGGFKAVENAIEGKYTSLFVYGALIGLIGGPPAFFVTGIGGGFGVNRKLVPPQDMDSFGDFVMLSALDPSASPKTMSEVRGNFPEKKGSFWFAAGVSFTSFALVDGVVVVAVEFGGGFELSAFGLARIALPNPDMALVSVELGLVARFSTDEPVIWVQSQLTENSWLFHESARLTGGFAYVSWLGGDKKGECVITLGGYHPSFHRDGYPVVPRMGFNWNPSSNISIKAETYFALTSEALMAGGEFSAHASFGPAFADLSFGGNAIVYFDPFRYQADAHAYVSAGIVIKIWGWKRKLSFTLGVSIYVEGPNFMGRATISVGPIDKTVRFGSSNQSSRHAILWSPFVSKYLEVGLSGRAKVLTGIAGKGSLTSGVNAAGRETGSADGSVLRPYEVIADFELVVQSSAPYTKLKLAGSLHETHHPTHQLGLSPMKKSINDIVLDLSILPTARPSNQTVEQIRRAGVTVTGLNNGAYPIGVWGVAPSEDHKKVPKGEVITAAESVRLKFTSSLSNPVPSSSTVKGISANRVEAGVRKPLPFVGNSQTTNRLVREGRIQSRIFEANTARDISSVSRIWQGEQTRESAYLFVQNRRAAPSRAGGLAERIIGAKKAGRKSPVKYVTERPKLKKFEAPLEVARIVLGTNSSHEINLAQETTLPKQVEALAGPMTAPLTMDDLRSILDVNVPVFLSITPSVAPSHSKTILADQKLPVTRSAQKPGSLSARSADFQPQPLKATTNIGAGEMMIYSLRSSERTFGYQNAGRIRISGRGRLIAVSSGGKILINKTTSKKNFTLPTGTADLAIISGDDSNKNGKNKEFAGFLATSTLGYIARGVSRAKGAVVETIGALRAPGGGQGAAGVVSARSLLNQTDLVSVTFDEQAQALGILLETQEIAKSLENISLGMSKADLTNPRPKIVPFGDATLLIYALKTDKQFGVSVGGIRAGELAGIIATPLDTTTLANRFIQQNIDLSISISDEERGKGCDVRWTKPKAMKADKTTVQRETKRRVK